MATRHGFRRTPLLGSALAVLIPVSGLAAPPVALSTQAVSARIRFESTCSAPGVSSASLSSPITLVPGLTGTLQVNASLFATEAQISFSGSANGPAAAIQFHVFLEIDAPIPQIGDAMTPVFVSLEDLTVSGSTWAVRSIGVAAARLPGTPACPLQSDRAAPSSPQLGSPLGDAWDYYSFHDLEIGAWPARTTNPVHLLPGETARIPIEVTVQLAHTAGTGTFSDSVRLAFRTSPTTIGNGDVNGDALVDIVDTTLIRRAIAGFPNP